MAFARYKEPWGTCSTCGFDVPVSRLRPPNGKTGWQCTGFPGANCADARPDRDDYLAARQFPAGEGTRRTAAPIVDPQEGIGADDLAEQGAIEQLNP